MSFIEDTKMRKYIVERRLCPCCRSEENKTLQKLGYTESPMKDHLEAYYAPIGGIEFDYLKDSDYILKECLDCGLIYQKEIPNSFLMGKLYEQWIDPAKVAEHYKQKHGADYFFWVSREMANLMKHFNASPSQLKFFDFAMGWGNWCLIAKGFGCEVYGAELSRTRVDNAESCGINVIGWEEIPDCKFNVINAEQVFEHLADPLETLLHLKKALKPGGVIRINVPQGAEIKTKIKKWNWRNVHATDDAFIPVAPLQHINCYTYDVLLNLGKKAGLKAVSITDHFKPIRRGLEDKVASTVKRISKMIRPVPKVVKRKPARIYFTHSTGRA